MSFNIEPIKPQIGAIVHIDRGSLSDPDVAKACLEALDAHDVLVFPKLGLNDAEQLTFTDSLGARVNFTRSAPGGDSAVRPASTKSRWIPKVNNEPEYVLGTYFWHMDGMPIVDIPPPKATLLTARRLAPKGGQTEFASTRAAYESFSAPRKRRSSTGYPCNAQRVRRRASGGGQRKRTGDSCESAPARASVRWFGLPSPAA